MGSESTQEMEVLNKKLLTASTQGSIGSLLELLVEDPLILDRAAVNCFNETPLHIAAMLGHIDFVKEIIRLKPQLVNELNLQQSSPLHLASAKGHVDVVRALLSVDQQACKTPNTEGHTPLHLAAAKGRVEAVKLLIEVQPEVARLKVYGGETNILHLCVKCYQLEALKILVESTVCESPEFINSRDDDGNTVLHLAVADKQVETTKFLVSVGAVDVNAVNNEGMTALDILIQSNRDMRDSAIKNSLKHGRDFGLSRKEYSPMKQHWLEEQRSSLMIVAILIATMAFQVGVNPPGGVWQQNEETSTPPQRAGYSVLAYNHPRGYIRFSVVNTIAFIASLTIILLLISGLPLKRSSFVWILIVIIWVAITAIAWCYALAVAAVTPSSSDAMIQIIEKHIPYAWIILMLLIIVANTTRMIIKLIKKLRKSFKDNQYCSCFTRGNNIIAI